MLGNSAVHCARYFAGLDKAHTQTTVAERELLAKYAGMSASLVEIGVYEGFTTRMIAEAMPERARLVAVDPFFRGRLGISWTRLIAHAEVAKARNKSVRFVELLSTEAAGKIDGHFDFVFVDGDHSLRGIATDWRLWSPRVVVGGIMAFHDTRRAAHAPRVSELGSYEFYNETIKTSADFKEIDSVDTLSIVRRLT